MRAKERRLIKQLYVHLSEAVKHDMELLSEKETRWPDWVDTLKETEKALEEDRRGK